MLAPEVIYGGRASRSAAGGFAATVPSGPGPRDGFATTAWCRGRHGSHDLSLYDENRCRDFGRRGVPDDLEVLAKEHPVRGVVNVRSWEECRAAIRNGYPVLVCSSQGFTMERDAEGFCNPRGWYHAMAVVGVRGGERPGGFLLNSWGPARIADRAIPPMPPAAASGPMRMCSTGCWSRGTRGRSAGSWGFRRVIEKQGIVLTSRKRKRRWMLTNELC